MGCLKCGAAKAYMESKKIGHDVAPDPTPDTTRRVIFEPRAEVRRFAEAMEREQVSNDASPGGGKRNLDGLCDLLDERLESFHSGLAMDKDVLDRAASLANCLVMICDALGEL